MNEKKQGLKTGDELNDQIDLAGDQAETEETSSAPADADVRTAEAPVTEPEVAVDPLVALEKERDELHERLLRVSADYQNYVRRSSQNVTAARDQQLIEIAKALITVLDHFDRALAVDPQKTTSASLLEGVQMVRDELLRALERLGIQRLNVKTGDAFDPNYHEALMRQPVEGVESDHVAEQLQPGYTLGEKTVRPAQVTVAE